MQTPIRVAISGAAGRVGYALMFRLAAGGMFGAEQPVSLSLLELPQSFPRLEAREMELRDCAFPLLTELRIGTDPRRMFEGADWVILLGGSTYRPEVQSGLDLLRENGPVMVDHGRAINHSAPTARVLVVTNPCNTNCLIAKSHAPDVPADHWFALNRVARMRATAMLAEKARVSVSQVSRVTVWGNSSETAYIDVSNAWIGEHHALEVINDQKMGPGSAPALSGGAEPPGHETGRLPPRRNCGAGHPGDHSVDLDPYSHRTVVQCQRRVRWELWSPSRIDLRLPTDHTRRSFLDDRSRPLPRGGGAGSTRSEYRRARARIRLGFPPARDRLITMLCWIKAARTGADFSISSSGATDFRPDLQGRRVLRPGPLRLLTADEEDLI